jgi:carboxypeptidase Taq
MRNNAVFGYFPTYLLGAMYATQIYRHAAGQIPDLEAKIEAGEFKPLRVRVSAAAA